MNKSIKSRAAVLFDMGLPRPFSKSKPIKVIDIDIDPPGFDEVLVKVSAAGLCHSDLSVVNGNRPRAMPMVLGHEGSGVVVAVGPGVKKVKPKNRVVLTWIKSKGIDADTPEFHGGCCGKVNAGKVTTFNEIAIISENRCVPLPDHIPMDVGALLGCAVLTGFGIITRELRPKKDSTIAIFGLGGIGMSALIACLSLSPSKLIAVDINSKKLKLAKALGATHCINAAKKNPEEEIKKLTPDTLGADYSVDCSGFVGTIEQAFNSSQQFDVFRSVIAPSSTSFNWLNLNKFCLPESKDMLWK